MRGPPALGLICVLSLAFTGCDGDTGERTEAVEVGWCFIGGCSGQLCTGPGGHGISTCAWKKEYACYRTAICAPQLAGLCGWTQTPELTACLAHAASEGSCFSDSDCYDGQVCERCDGGHGRCTVGCRRDSQCQAGQQCRAVQCAACPCPSQCS